MAREMDKLHKELGAFLSENATETMGEAQINELLQVFMKQYNDAIPKQEKTGTPKTADDYLELAENARSEKDRLKYAQKALALDPDNLDAEAMVAELSTRNLVELLENYEKAIEHGNHLMTKEGFMTEENIGDFWGIIETRPYMRLRNKYLHFLIDMGMLRKAATEAEDMIRLCEHDNLGVRHILINLYAYLEDEAAALELAKKYGDYEETQILLGLSILYFKRRDLDKAKEYLQKVAKINPDTSKYFRAIRRGMLEEYADQVSDYGYRPFTIEELIVNMHENEFLFSTLAAYMWWADRALIVKKK